MTLENFRNVEPKCLMKSKEKIIDMTTTEWEIDTLYSGQREREESMEEYGRVWESM